MKGEWASGALLGPTSGRPLLREGDYLVDRGGTERWPVVEGIPYLRAGREGLVREVCGLLDRGEKGAALASLLRDRDDWAPGPPPDRAPVAAAVSAAQSGRPAGEVMELLGFGAVADYFAYRLSDPTYLAGLALMQAHWNAPETSFELACGIGHYTRELARRGVRAIAGDVVFAKLWLARRYVVPEARLVCFDASRRFPLEGGAAQMVLCHDAFYFLPAKAHVASELERVAGPEGTVLVGHSHNAAAENFSAGEPLSAGEHQEIFPSARLYDDAGLTAALLDGAEPRARAAAELGGSEALGVGVGGGGAASRPDLSLPPPGTPLVPSPLYRRGGGDPERLTLVWPSERYREEYAPRSFYLPEEVEVSRTLLDRAAQGAVGCGGELDDLVRRRVLVEDVGR